MTGWPAPDEVGTVAAVKFGLLGDLLLADPALSALRARYPAARLRLVADSPAQAAWLRPGAVDEIHPVFIGAHRSTYRRLYDPRLWRDVLALRRQPPARLAVFLNDAPTAYQRRLFAGLAWSLQARWRFGVRTRQTRYLTGGPSPAELAGRHEIERGWLIAGGAGPAPLPRLPDPDDSVAARVRQARERTRARRVIVLQPFTAKPAKQWPVPRFVELARAIVERLDGLVVLVGSASEAPGAGAFGELGGRCLEIFGAPIAGLVAALRACDAFVGHDSGPFHVAVAAARPSVALVGPSDPKYSRYPFPWARPLRRCVLAADEGECPRYLSCRDPRCLPSLAADEAFAVLADLLSLSRPAA